MARKHICIDFEGEGKRADGTLPHPSMLGALVPGLDGRGKTYHLWMFEPEWLPMTRSPQIEGSPANRKVCTLEQAVEELLTLADALDCRLVAFSEHEANMVNQHLPQNSNARRGFSERFYNIRPKAKALANRRRLQFADNTLISLLTALAPGHRWPPPPACGVAEACRRLRGAGARSNKWRRWLPRHQQLAKDLIRYNRGDCVAVWRLVNRVCAHYSIEALQ
jgi:hypothetical protein